jgi:selenide,water dikinase
VRFLPGAVEYVLQDALPGGLANNRDFASCAVERTRELSAEVENLLYDPQTSGGLLVSMSEAAAEKFQKGYRIGRVLPRQSHPIRIL